MNTTISNNTATTARAIVASVLLAAAAGSVLAESPTVVTEPFVSTRTRAEVVADLAAFKQSGANPWAASYNPLRHFRSTTTRDAVVAAYLVSRDEVKALNGEDSGSVYLAKANTSQAVGQMLAGVPRNAQ
jgi:hypothetical protein